MGRGCAELQQAAKGKWEDGLEGGSGETGKARMMFRVCRGGRGAPPDPPRKQGK